MYREKAKTFKRNIIFSLKYKTLYLMAINTVLQPQYIFCLVSIYSAPQGPISQLQKHEFFHSERLLLE